ncbi:Chromosome-partitioning protein Spo0J [Phycisphaerae bacterium RAS2]|nr:Chromosome-partitioning protein Spo0J [Phycisphaerae bacterium RAS2]
MNNGCDEISVQYPPLDQVGRAHQPRQHFDEDAMTGLARSIAECGVLQPLLVRREGTALVVLDGERRLRAAKQAGLTHVPVILADGALSESDVLRRQLVANCQRQDLTPLETARAIDQLIKSTECSAAQVAVQLGMSSSKVSKLLALLAVPADMQLRIEREGLGLSAAYQIALAGNSEAQERLLSDLTSGTLTRDGAAALRKARPRTRRSKRSRRAGGLGKVVVPLGGGRSIAFTGPDLTLQAITDWLQDLLTRIKGLEPQDMELAHAVKALAVSVA